MGKYGNPLEMKQLNSLRTHFLVLSNDTVIQDSQPRWEFAGRTVTRNPRRQLRPSSSDFTLYPQHYQGPGRITTESVAAQQPRSSSVPLPGITQSTIDSNYDNIFERLHATPTDSMGKAPDNASESDDSREEEREDLQEHARHLVARLKKSELAAIAKDGEIARAQDTSMESLEKFRRQDAKFKVLVKANIKLKGDIHRLNVELEQAASKLHEIKASVKAETGDQLAMKAKTVLKQENQITRARDQNSQLTSELTVLRGRLEKMAAELARAKKNEDKSWLANRKTKGRLADALGLVNLRQQQADKTTSDHEVAEYGTRQLEALGKVRDANTELADKLKKREQRLAATQEQLATSGAREENLTEQLRASNERVNALEGQVFSLETELGVANKTGGGVEDLSRKAPTGDMAYSDSESENSAIDAAFDSDSSDPQPELGDERTDGMRR
jgi:hypothetical protein